MPNKTREFFKEKKLWSVYKDKILGNYLKPYFQKMSISSNSTIYIDGFAGKGVFDDGSKGSPLIVKDILVNIQKSSTNKKKKIFPAFIENKYANELESNFKKFGAKSLSFQSIVAINENSALAHYNKSDKDKILKDGDLVLIDCGAYYDKGLATDITRVFVKGEPSELQKQVYTTVLKVFLNCYNYQMTSQTTGFEIDKLAHCIFDKNTIDGFEFSHGLGHGVGISVHEAPPNLSKNEIAKTVIKDNMCFTIEPGLYNEKEFGVRLENTCYLKNGEIVSFAKMPFEKKLIDMNLLTDAEKEYLQEFEVV